MLKLLDKNSYCDFGLIFVEFNLRIMDGPNQINGNATEDSFDTSFSIRWRNQTNKA